MSRMLLEEEGGRERERHKLLVQCTVVSIVDGHTDVHNCVN